MFMVSLVGDALKQTKKKEMFGEIFYLYLDIKFRLDSRESETIVLKSISIECSLILYRGTSLYARVRDCKNRLAYNEFAYKKTKDYCKSVDRFLKRCHFWIAFTQNPI